MVKYERFRPCRTSRLGRLQKNRLKLLFTAKSTSRRVTRREEKDNLTRRNVVSDALANKRQTNVRTLALNRYIVGGNVPPFWLKKSFFLEC